MTENEKKEQSNTVEQTSSISSKTKLEDNIIVGGEIVKITKLRAGEFYKLQKVFGEILRSAVASGDKVDKMDADQVAKLFGELPGQVAEFVAICAGMSKEELLEKAYPEEIAEAFGKGLALNNVIDNLKKSVAPMQMLGAEIKE